MFRVTLYNKQGQRVKFKAATPSIRIARKHRDDFHETYSDDHYVEIVDLEVDAGLSRVHWKCTITGNTGNGEPMSIDKALYAVSDGTETNDSHAYWIEQANLVRD